MVASAAHVPTRTCVGCGCRGPRPELERLRADTSGTVRRARPGDVGRSAYVHPGRECVLRLRKSRLLAKSIGRPVERDEREDIISRLTGE